MQIHDLQDDGIFLMNVFHNFDQLLYNIDKFPGVFLWDDEDCIFIPITSERDVINIFESLHFVGRNKIASLKRHYMREFNLSQNKNLDILHISDLHLGAVDSLNIREFWAQVEEKFSSKNTLAIISGDIVDSPGAQSCSLKLDFLQRLNKLANNRVIVLGNHDVKTKGIVNSLRSIFCLQASIGMLGEHDTAIKRYDNFKIVIIPIYSCEAGKFARGYISDEQLQKISTDLDNIENIHDYTIIVTLHHHVCKISYPDWYKKEWHERLFGKYHDKAMLLQNSNKFLEWCKEHDVKIILHGHKHIPFIQQSDNLWIIGAGSATGATRHMDQDKVFLSYNVIKYDIDNAKPLNVTITVIENIGFPSKHMATQKLD
jgi:predicted phosphodiesterase